MTYSDNVSSSSNAVSVSDVATGSGPATFVISLLRGDPMAVWRAYE